MVIPGGRYSILVVEDNPDIVIGLQDLLQHDGYDVTVAGTCCTASSRAVSPSTIMSVWVGTTPVTTKW